MSYNDYPKSAVNNAKKALKWRDEYGRNVVKGGTKIGWTRANQIANKENLSEETIRRIKAFFDRHKGNEKIDPKFKNEPWKDRGYISFLIWGGKSMHNWATKMVNKFNKLNEVKENVLKELTENDKND